jgi:2-keto-3-deoxy-L-rhamnonate aldolase RhmA
MSGEVWTHIKNAVMERLEEKLRVAGLTTGMPDFLMSEVAGAAAALMALQLNRENTHGALEGAMLATVLRELHNMRRLILVPVTQVGKSEYKARIASLDAALLFLENPK